MMVRFYPFRLSALDAGKSLIFRIRMRLKTSIKLFNNCKQIISVLYF